MNTTAAVNMPFTSDIKDSVQDAQPREIAAKFEELETLFRNHHKTIFSVAYRITGSASDAEDVLQTIFLRLTRNPQRDFSPNAGGFMYRTAVNASLDLLRKHRRSGSVSLEELDFEPNANLSGSPEDNVADSELRGLIRRAMAKLEGRAATAFALRYFEDLDNQRIAQILGTSQMVVAVTLHRARTRLRKEIGSYLEKNYEV